MVRLRFRQYLRMLVLVAMAAAGALVSATGYPEHSPWLPRRCALTATYGTANWNGAFVGDKRIAAVGQLQGRCTWQPSQNWMVSADLGGGRSDAWSDYEGPRHGVAAAVGHARVLGGWEGKWWGLALGAVGSPQSPEILSLYPYLLPVYRLRLGPNALFFHSGFFDGGIDGGVLHTWTSGVGSRWELVEGRWAWELLVVGHDNYSWDNAFSLALRVLGPKFGLHAELLGLDRHECPDCWNFSFGREGFALSFGIDYPGAAQ